jgi:diguanylate cyclase
VVIQSGEQDAGAEYASAALQAIADNGLQLDPKTFAVWYEYHRGADPGLRRVIDIIRTNRTSVSPGAMERIFERFIANVADYRIIRDTADKMQHTLAQLQALVGEAHDGAGQFGRAIRSVSGQFAANEVSIGALVQGLLGEARDIAARTARIQSELTRNAELMQTMQRTLEDARREANTDPLTGLANRRSFDEALQAHAGAAMNEGRDLTLMLIDIDHFKRVNDRWGHPVGDEVLKLAATTVRSGLREGDVAARYGGEEFAVVLPGLSLDGAVEAGERIRSAFAGHQVVLRGSGQSIGTVTVSVGAAAYDPGEPLAQWVGRTDAALYAAKQGGRNRVVASREAALAG